jgi:hypothetical protein
MRTKTYKVTISKSKEALLNIASDISPLIIAISSRFRDEVLVHIVIPTLGRLRQEDHEFQDSLG